MIKDLVGKTCIVKPHRDVANKWTWRRGVIIESRRQFGAPKHLVVLERRGREADRKLVWLPQAALMPRSPKNEAALANMFDGRDDASRERL